MQGLLVIFAACASLKAPFVRLAGPRAYVINLDNIASV